MAAPSAGARGSEPQPSMSSGCLCSAGALRRRQEMKSGFPTHSECRQPWVSLRVCLIPERSTSAFRSTDPGCRIPGLQPAVGARPPLTQEATHRPGFGPSTPEPRLSPPWPQPGSRGQVAVGDRDRKQAAARLERTQAPWHGKRGVPGDVSGVLPGGTALGVSPRAERC